MDPIKYQSGYKYQLKEDYVCSIRIHPTTDIVTEYIVLEVSGRLTIKNGYAWDGPSGPTIDSKNFMRGSLVHDALYQLIREGWLLSAHRAEADWELWRICKADGMSSIRAQWVYQAVRTFGAGPAARQKEIMTAP